MKTWLPKLAVWLAAVALISGCVAKTQAPVAVPIPADQPSYHGDPDNPGMVIPLPGTGATPIPEWKGPVFDAQRPLDVMVGIVTEAEFEPHGRGSPWCSVHIKFEDGRERFLDATSIYPMPNIVGKKIQLDSKPAEILTIWDLSEE